MARLYHACIMLTRITDVSVPRRRRVIVMGDSVKSLIVERLDRLPGPVLQEVLNFIDSLSQRKASLEDPILAVAGMLAGTPVSADEIERELYGEDAR
jgi:hypothetical protein